MVLMKSISGIRGTIGGDPIDSLSAHNIVQFTTGFSQLLMENKSKNIIIGRDARISGEMISNLVSGTLLSYGFNVIDVGLSTTPTVEMAVQLSDSAGGIVITASHNPKEWNALKFLNEEGEFLSKTDGEKLLEYAKNNNLNSANINNIGKYTYNNSFNDQHIDEILKLDLIDINLIKSSNFKVVLDAVNSTGGFMIPKLLSRLGVSCIKLYCDPTGDFPHNPEPLPENLIDISRIVVKEQADFGIVVDPDVDRLAIVCEDGSMFGEEYTLVSIADYILSKTPGNTVSNLSSTRALLDITNKYRQKYEASAVGEVNVVKKMKEINAVIGGEGNGGIIYPKLHYGRDAILGIAFFLMHLAEKKISCKALKGSYPEYFLSKKKLELENKIDINKIMSLLEEKYSNEKITRIDGLKIDFKNEWVHLRKSNTEPIIRIYAESTIKERSEDLAKEIINEIQSLI